MKEAKRVGLWPLRDAEDVMTSVENLAEMIMSINIERYHGDEGEEHCFAFNFKDEVMRILRGIPSPARPRHLAHIDAQREKMAGRY